jgi:hypothetical protein
MPPLLTDLRNIITSLTSIQITGYSFGQSKADVTSLTAQTIPCSNIFYASPQSIGCLHTSLPPEVTSDDVQLTIHSTRLQGIHLQPLTIAKSDSHRPVIAEIKIQSLPFLPYTVTLPLSLSPVVTPCLYWSDIFSHEIFRSQLDGGMVQLVLQQVCLSLSCPLSPHPPSGGSCLWNWSDRRS